MKYLFACVSLALTSISCNNSTETPSSKALAKDTTKAVENKIMIPASTC
ncbi:hypothetical protein [Ferruginibacter profundus]